MRRRRSSGCGCCPSTPNWCATSWSRHPLCLAADDDPASVELPDTGLAPSWAGVSPPRSGWSAQPGLEASTLAARAQWGIAAVAESMPQNPGEDAVRAVRATVWGRLGRRAGRAPARRGVRGVRAGLHRRAKRSPRVLTSGPWTRVSLARGHIIVRGPARVGLTAVRATGAPDSPAAGCMSRISRRMSRSASRTESFLRQRRTA